MGKEFGKGGPRHWGIFRSGFPVELVDQATPQVIEGGDGEHDGAFQEVFHGVECVAGVAEPTQLFLKEGVIERALPSSFQKAFASDLDRTTGQA